MTVHIIGAGISGLSAAFALVKAGVSVCLHDAAGHAGGRCHSYFDKVLDAPVDNGTHLMMGANTALLGMLSECPTDTPLKNMGSTLSFMDKSGKTFKVDTARPLAALTKVPVLYSLLCESVMNTPAHQADKVMFLKTALKCFGKTAGQVYLAYPTLSDSVVAPIISFLKSHNVPFRFGKRLQRINADRLSFFNGEEIPLAKDDRVILAVPADTLSRLIVGAPEMPHHTIANIHFKTPAKLPDGVPFIGLVGMTGHWAFVKNGVLSVTISTADALTAQYAPMSLAALVWHELSKVLKVPVALPPCRVILEKRATVAQSAAVNRLRLPTDIGNPSVFLAGDATATGLPCTIEGSVRSGFAAAQKVIASLA